MFQLHHIKARVVRLDKLTQAFAKEIVTVAEGEDLLLQPGAARISRPPRWAADGLDEARVVLASVAKGLEKGCLPTLLIRQFVFPSECFPLEERAFGEQAEAHKSGG